MEDLLGAFGMIAGHILFLGSYKEDGVCPCHAAAFDVFTYRFV